MKTASIVIGPVLVLLLLTACATIPTGPSVMVLPGPNKPFEVFQAEDDQCRNWALSRIGRSPQETANQNVASGAGVGAAVGAGLGAIIGAGSGHAASGAAVGAASGMLLGAAQGADVGQASGWEAQRRYDIAYQQCMYANGNIIPNVRRTGHPRQLLPPPPPTGWDRGTVH
jgi:hypothetical protein